MVAERNCYFTIKINKKKSQVIPRQKNRGDGRSGLSPADWTMKIIANRRIVNNGAFGKTPSPDFTEESPFKDFHAEKIA